VVLGSHDSGGHGDLQFFVEPVRKRRRVRRRLSEVMKSVWNSLISLKEGSAESTGRWPKLLARVLGEQRLGKLKNWMMQADVHEPPEKTDTTISIPEPSRFVAGVLVLKSLLLGLLLRMRGRSRHLLLSGTEKKNQDEEICRPRCRMYGTAWPVPCELAMLCRQPSNVVGRKCTEPMGNDMMIVLRGAAVTGSACQKPFMHLLERRGEHGSGAISLTAVFNPTGDR